MKSVNGLRFGQTASGTVKLAQPNPRPKPADEKVLNDKKTKIQQIKITTVE